MQYSADATARPGPWSGLAGCLLDFEAYPGRYPLALREPRFLFDHGTEVLMLASGRVLDGLPQDPALEARLRQAARFFVRIALLRHGVDHYTLMGVAPGFDAAVLREHYRMLIRLTHPDFVADGGEWPAGAATRINLANDVLCSPQRRQDYDLAQPRGRQWAPSVSAPVLPLPVFRPHAGQSHSGAPRRRVVLPAVAVASVLLLSVWLWSGTPDGDHGVNVAQVEGAAMPGAAPTPAPAPMPAAAPAAPALVPAPVAAAPLPVPTAARVSKPVPAPVPAAASAPALARIPASVLPSPRPAVGSQAPSVAVPVLAPVPPRVLTPAPATVVAGVSGRLSEPSPALRSTVVLTLPTAIPAPSIPASAAPLPRTPSPAVEMAPVSPAPPVSRVAAVVSQPAAVPVLPQPAVLALAAPATRTPAAPEPGPQTARIGMADVQPLLGHVLGALQSGRGEQVLPWVERPVRQGDGADSFVQAYNRVVANSRSVRLGAVQFSGRPQGEQLLVDGVVVLHVQDENQQLATRELVLRAQFASRGGQPVMTQLSASEIAR